MPPPHFPHTKKSVFYQRRRQKRAEAQTKSVKEAAKDISEAKAP
jgi:hypothetical protein